jgi:hypothetical protein
MRDPDPFEVLEEALRTRETSNAKPARRVLPWISLAQELRSELSQSFDGG